MSKILIVFFAAFLFSTSFSFCAEKVAPKVLTAKEKKELEKRFAKLSNFYIADDGTVVIYKIKKTTPPAKKKVTTQVPKEKKQVSTEQKSGDKE